MRQYRVANVILSVALSIVFGVAAIMVFSSSYLRAFEALLDLFGSIKYYFCVLFGKSVEGLPSVTKYSNVMQWQVDLPSTWEAFTLKASKYLDMFFSKDNFLSWLYSSGETMYKAAMITTILLPCILMLFMVIRSMYNQHNVKHNQDTIPLKVFKGLSKITYQPIKRFVRQYLGFVREHRPIWIGWAVLWAFNLNFVSIIITFFAFYFYFAVSFDFVGIYMQVVKLSIDFQMLFARFPWWSMLPIAWLIFEKWRKGIAIYRLNKMESANRGLINDLPIVSMTCGSMGKKKTTIITDMALSQEVMFRKVALDRMQKADMKFPNFGWIAFEMELRRCMEHGTVYNLATVKEWVNLKKRRYDLHQNNDLQLYGYDSDRYGLYYQDGLKTQYIFDVLETYAQLYFIYVIESSLIVANYSIRTDNELMDAGNFPLWQDDFFSDRERCSRHSHILDFDVLRLGKKVIENNPNAGSFEFGVVAITEVGKERGNNLELKEVKKGTEETNQKNDLFNSWLKMCRHSATVDNYPFVKVFTDEQRPSSWGADARDLCDIVHIVSSSEQSLALPFFTIEDMLNEWLFDRFMGLYESFRFNRGDNTLLVHLLKQLTAMVFRRHVRIYNTYGFSVSKVEKERGTMDGKPEKKKYYLMSKKIYSNRFSTDCFSDYFNDMAKKTNVGLNDYLEYATEKASIDELKMQNSYFINSLYKRNEEETA